MISRKLILMMMSMMILLKGFKESILMILKIYGNI